MEGNETRSPRMADMACLGEQFVSQPKSYLESASDAAEGLRVHPTEHFKDRTGYDPTFIPDFTTPLPETASAYEADRAPLLDGSGYVLNYTNFSLEMSISRKIAIYTACNIDGRNSKKIKRNYDKWYFDGRIDLEHQVGERLYRRNDLDRGHLVRRLDPVWGENAALANDDTFHFTNCSPQHSGLNQETWLGLEHYILQNARVEDLKVNVFTGPILSNDDMIYRNVKIPKEYWKVVAIRTDGRSSATAYKISQDELISGLEFVFGRYKTYQVSIRNVEEKTGLTFGDLSQYDGFSNEEIATGTQQRVVLESWQSIRV